MSHYVACYDMVDNKHRYKVTACLDAYGDRVQNSVFELPMDRTLLDKCLAEVAGLLDEAKDNAAIYRLGSACATERFYLGVGEKAERLGDEQVFIA